MATVIFVVLTHHLKLMGLRPHYFKEVHQDMSLRKKEMNMKRHLLIIIKKNIKKNNQRFQNRRKYVPIQLYYHMKGKNTVTVGKIELMVEYSLFFQYYDRNYHKCKIKLKSRERFYGIMFT